MKKSSQLFFELEGKEMGREVLATGADESRGFGGFSPPHAYPLRRIGRVYVIPHHAHSS